KMGSEARSTATSPTLVATAQTRWPVETPSAVPMPAARPPRTVFRIVSAVSGPGATITTVGTARKVSTSSSFLARPRVAERAQVPVQIVTALEVVRRVEEIGRRALALGLHLLHGGNTRLEVRVVGPPRLARILPREVGHAEEVAGLR